MARWCLDTEVRMHGASCVGEGRVLVDFKLGMTHDVNGDVVLRFGR